MSKRETALVNTISRVVRDQIGVQLEHRDAELHEMRLAVDAITGELKKITEMAVQEQEKAKEKTRPRPALFKPKPVSSEAPATATATMGGVGGFEPDMSMKGTSPRPPASVQRTVAAPPARGRLVAKVAGSAMPDSLLNKKQLLPPKFNAPRCAYPKPEPSEEDPSKYKFKYAECRSAVYMPSFFPALDTDLLHAAPETDLELEFAFGYHSTGVNPILTPNLFTLKSGEVCWFTSAVICLFDRKTSSMRFFNEHDDDISACAVHPNGKIVASGQLGAAPPVHIWYTQAQTFLPNGNPDKQLPPEARICTLSGHQRKISSLDFSHDGKLLLSLGGDDQNTCVVWDWKRAIVLATAPTNTAPVSSMRWNPFQAFGLPDTPGSPLPGQAGNSEDAVYTLVSCGQRHIKFWVLLQSEDDDMEGGETSAPLPAQAQAEKKPSRWFLEGNQASMGTRGYVQDIASFDFVDDSDTTSAGQSERAASRIVAVTKGGDIYVFSQPCIDLPDLGKRLWDSHATLIFSVPGTAEVGAKYNLTRAQRDEKTSYKGPLGHGGGGATSVSMSMASRLLVTAGKDGKIKVWDPFKKSKGKKGPELVQVANKTGKPSLLSLMDMQLSGKGAEEDSVGESPAVVALYPSYVTWTPKGNALLFGTSTNDIMEAPISLGIIAASPLTLHRGHFGRVEALDVHPAQDELVTAGHDRMVMVWSISQRRCIAMAKLPAAANCVCYHPDGGSVTVGLDNNEFCVYKLVQDAKPEIGPDTGVALQAVARKSVTAAAKIVARSKGGKKGNAAGLSDIKYAPNGKICAIGSHDRLIYLFHADLKASPPVYKKVGVLKGHTSTITHLDWSQNSRFLQSNSQDYEILYWEVLPPDGETKFKPQQFKEAHELRDEQWATWTCILGWPVQGIWPDDSDGTDINSVHRSHSMKYCLTADDFKKVRLLNYPSLKDRRGQEAESKAYIAHASHVINAKFVFNDSYVASIGGMDATLMVWKHVNEAGTLVAIDK